MTDNPLLRSLTFHSHKRRAYKPKEGEKITIELPGEIIAAEVIGVGKLSDRCLVKLTSVPMAKTHTHRKGDTLAVIREVDEFLGVEKWVEFTDQEMNAQILKAQFEAEERAREELAEAEAKAKEMPTGEPVTTVYPAAVEGE